MNNSSNGRDARMEQHHDRKQTTFDFDEAEPGREPARVARDTSMPPPLVRPDRQVVYESPNPYEWPSPDGLHDHDTITVDRVQSSMDGPAHRFIIKRGDLVEAWFGKHVFHAGTVVGVSHARNEVRVRFTEGAGGQWFSAGAIYPCPEPPAELRHNARPLSSSVGLVNGRNAPPDGFSDADLVPLPTGPDQVLAYLKESAGTEHTASELRERFRHVAFDADDPLKNPVHQALANLRDRGLIHVEEPRFGEPRFSVLHLPDAAAELTRGHCPRTLAGLEVRRLLRENGWTIKDFAERWKFTQEHVRRVFDRGLTDQNSVHDWIEAALTSPRAVPLPEAPKTEAPAYTFDEFKELLKRRGRHESFGQYQTDFERLLGSRETVITELLTRYKAPQLKNVAGNLGEWGARSNTKRQNAESIYQKMLGSFLLDGVVSYGMNERYDDAVANKVRAVTEESWNEHFAAVAEEQKEREERSPTRRACLILRRSSD